jgi:hypothetical protein
MNDSYETHEGYSCFHPWYYKLGGSIPNFKKWVIDDDYLNDVERYFYKGKITDKNKLEEFLEKSEEELKADITRFNEIAYGGLNAVSDYDKEIACAGDEWMAVYTGMSLKVSHIYNGMARIVFAKKHLKLGQTTLF